MKTSLILVIAAIVIVPQLPMSMAELEALRTSLNTFVGRFSPDAPPPAIDPGDRNGLNPR